MPDRLFKFVGFSPRALQQLCMGEVYFADPSGFNDPLDCRPKVGADLSIHDLKEVLAKLVVRRVAKEVSASMRQLRFKAETIATRQESLAQKVFDTLVNEIQYEALHPEVGDVDAQVVAGLVNAIEIELRQAYYRGVLCLSSRFDSPLMWSHYADQHRGICIEFDVSKLPPDQIKKMQYGDSRIVPASAVLRWLRDDDESSRKEVERACLLTKSAEWQYEEEYRLLNQIGVRPSMIPVRSITFGLKCDVALQYAMIAALGGDRSPLEYFEIRSPDSNFVLHRYPVEVAELLIGMPRTNMSEEFQNLAIDATKNNE